MRLQMSELNTYHACPSCNYTIKINQGSINKIVSCDHCKNQYNWELNDDELILNKVSNINDGSSTSSSSFEIDRLVDKFAWLGVPGIVLLVVISISPYFGGAAITWALNILGGPFGMIVGIGTLLFISRNSKKITDYGIKKFLKRVIKKMKKNGETNKDIKRKINNYPLSKDMKSKVLSYIDDIE